MGSWDTKLKSLHSASSTTGKLLTFLILFVLPSVCRLLIDEAVGLSEGDTEDDDKDDLINSLLLPASKSLSLTRSRSMYLFNHEFRLAPEISSCAMRSSMESSALIICISSQIVRSSERVRR